MTNLEKEIIDYINGMPINRNIKPNYEFIKNCLVWPDEISENLRGEAGEFIYDLLIVRGFVHKSIPSDQWGFESSYLINVWEEGIRLVPNWPGFKRIILSSDDKKYLEQCMCEDRSLALDVDSEI